MASSLDDSLLMVLKLINPEMESCTMRSACEMNARTELDKGEMNAGRERGTRESNGGRRSYWKELECGEH